MLTSLVNQWEMLSARSSRRRRGPDGCTGASQTMAYLSSCGYPPVLSSLTFRQCPSIRTGPPVLHRTLSPSPPPTLCFFLSPFLWLLPLGRVSIFIRTKEMVTVTEKEERQLDGHGLEIVLHVFACNTVCTSFSLRPHFFLSLSCHPSLCFDTSTIFQFLFCSWFLFSLLLLLPPLFRFVLLHI